ncbi:imidazole glycerol phosphate synthase subunit HisH [Microcella sp.]|jgi:glutamine amidotransferase|uniref:imidazole glycerol phosphate synthase subunit HisH n=1 Tax=Microcella sp. TaxID=1913979 RepID=UPI00299F6450|nr:imidazole glycerol phosphate synthase subunit HisH [Microcella sp.]MDX2026926.1 imidazole glycerol phosphate synthase subunit HisH [Microcella sp.]
MNISLVSYGLGNLGSVVNMGKRAGAKVTLVSTPDEVLASERVILPGVGAFDEGMDRLQSRGLVEALREFAASGRPLLGICLGMQLLLDGSEEGTSPGLGLVPGNSVRFSESAGVRVPHMGWNTVEPTRADPLVEGLPDDSRFYFVHSYRVVPNREEDQLATTNYGGPFASMIRADNVVGAQFHPEKSHAFGMTILKNFAAA